MYVTAFRRADHSSKEPCRLCKDYETEEEARAQQRAVQPLMNKLVENSTGAGSPGVLRVVMPFPFPANVPFSYLPVDCTIGPLLATYQVDSVSPHPTK
jgi:hypothetical protein